MVRVLLSEHDEGRPGEERPHNVTAGDTHSVSQGSDVERQPRCLMCGHIVTSAESIAAGLGRDCRRRLRRGLRHSSANVRRIFAEILETARAGAA